MTEPKSPRSGKSNRRPRERRAAEEGVSSQIADQSRARSLQRSKYPREFRLRKIVDLMLASEWVKGVTAAELALEWELDTNTVEHDATDASRFIGLCLDPEDVRRHSMVYLRRLAESGEPHAVRAIEVALKTTGNLTERVDVSVSSKPSPDMYAAALEHEGFRAYLLEQGWKPPKGRPVLTTGVET